MLWLIGAPALALAFVVCMIVDLRRHKPAAITLHPDVPCPHGHADWDDCPVCCH